MERHPSGLLEHVKEQRQAVLIERHLLSMRLLLLPAPCLLVEDVGIGFPFLLEDGLGLQRPVDVEHPLRVLHKQGIQEAVDALQNVRVVQNLLEEGASQRKALHGGHVGDLLEFAVVEGAQVEVVSEDPLVLVDGTGEVPLNLLQVVELVLLGLCEVDRIHAAELLLPRLDVLPVPLKLLLCGVDGVKVLLQDLPVLRDLVVQGVSLDADHGLLDLLDLDAHQVEDVPDIFQGFVIALLLQVELEDHLVDREL